jgi:hypothetical protein
MMILPRRKVRSPFHCLLASLLLSVIGACDMGTPNGGDPDNPAGQQQPGEEALAQADPISVQVEGQGSVTQDITGPVITLTAVPEEGWLFTGWGNIPSSENPVSIMADEFSEGQARFAPDADEDGVEDALDLCPGTAAGDATHEDGCSANQIDADRDGIPDRRDRCADTPVDSEVDENGCAATQRDTDGDTILDADDRCPDTPADKRVDERGCSASQRDGDRDGVKDAVDECPNTAADSLVDAVGCASVQRDSDVDGVPDNDDLCPGTMTGASVDLGGCPTFCGNGFVEFGEQCDPPDGVICDAQCRFIFDVDPPDNDLCTDAIAVDEGTHEFTNLAATDVSPTFFGTQCASIAMGADVWFCYTTTCSDAVTISLCDSALDTTMVVYEGCTCDNTDPFACDDDYCGVGSGSQVDFATSPGQSYLIQVGGYASDMGAGVLEISCGTPPDPAEACGAGAGDCMVENGSPGCEDVDCCEFICSFAPSCCTTEWDEECALGARLVCVDVDTSACGPGSGDCYANNGSAGCEDESCCEIICAFMPECCATNWDQTCASSAQQFCVMMSPFSCEGATGDCLAPNDTPGCEDVTCCETVCAIRPTCCTVEWDEDCAQLAENQCGGGGYPSCGPGAGDCMTANGTPGCDDAFCCELVCTIPGMSYCCTDEWDDTCAFEADFFCESDVDISACGPGAGDCMVAHSSPGCEDETCCTLVCTTPQSEYCCTEEWDPLCAFSAEFLCGEPADTSVCVPGSGACFTENGTPGCEDLECCSMVCLLAPECCNDGWDEECAAVAEAICVGGTGTFDACGPGSGDCQTGNGSPGCQDTFCCTMVCVLQPECCLQEWDDACAEIADFACFGAFDACGPGGGDCYAAHPSPGCDDELCCTGVCTSTPECCFDTWSEQCADVANLVCSAGTGTFPGCGSEGSGGCFVSNGTPACEDETCCNIVCSSDPYCCINEWDDICAEEAAGLCP